MNFRGSFIHYYERNSSQILNIVKTRSSKFEINILTYDSPKIWNQFHFDFVFNEFKECNLNLKQY